MPEPLLNRWFGWRLCIRWRNNDAAQDQAVQRALNRLPLKALEELAAMVRLAIFERKQGDSR